MTTTNAAIEVRVPSMLRGATSGEKVVHAEGDNVRQVLEDLTRRYPAVGDGLFEPGGQLRRFVNVYVNDEDIRYLGKLEAPVRRGDTVSILPAVAGGASVRDWLDSVRSELVEPQPQTSS